MQAVAQSPFQLGRPGEIPKEGLLPYFTVQINRKGEVSADGGSFFDLSDSKRLKTIVDAAYFAEDSVGEIKEFRLRYLKAEKPDGSTTIVFADITTEQATVANLIKICALIAVLSFAVFFVISVFLSRWAVKPVDKAWKQQRQFVADASHELKTPLTIIMTNAELLQNEDCGEEDKNRFSENILSTSGRMRSLTENLLDLARADNGTSKAVFEEMNLSEAVYDSVLQFEPLYFEKGKNLYYKIDKDINLFGSAEQLRRVADILLDNALKYSFDETSVWVELIKKERICVLSVKSIGEHIGKDDLKNIFKRFYRIDEARTGGESYGLGLSIAETIVKEHKGKIWEESKENENVFYVQMPI